MAPSKLQNLEKMNENRWVTKKTFFCASLSKKRKNNNFSKLNLSLISEK